MSEAVRWALGERTTIEPEGPRPLTRPVDEPEPLPLAALGPLRVPTEAIHAHTRAPIEICAQAVLGAIALVGQGHADVVLPSGQLKPLSMFLMTIAGSGERKSAVDRLALHAIYDYEEELRAAYRVDISNFEIGQAIWEAQHAAAKAEMRGGKKKRGIDAYDAEADLRALGPGPQPPLTPLLLCPEPTFEGYCKLTAIGQPAKLSLYADEFWQPAHVVRMSELSPGLRRALRWPPILLPEMLAAHICEPVSGLVGAGARPGGKDPRQAGPAGFHRHRQHA